MRNRTGDSKSPFVRAHIDTLVSWQLLDDEAVERAKKENKLIFMTIGYLASHCESRIASRSLDSLMHACLFYI